MKKLRVFTNVQKEEKWLNEMLQKGWQLTNINMIQVYSFEKTTNRQQILRIDSQSFASKEQFEGYKALYEEFDWNHVVGSRSSMLQYWLNQSDKDVELFSDQSSQKNYFQRLSKLCGTFAFFSFSSHFVYFKT